MVSARPCRRAAALRRMRAALAAAALLCAGPAAGSAQVISGRVIEAASGIGVADVRITVLAGDDPVAGVRTDSAGGFALRTPACRCRLRLEHAAHATVTTAPLVLAEGETLALELRLGAAALALDPLVVVARGRSSGAHAAFYARMSRYRAAGIGRFMTRDRIDESAAPDVNRLLLQDPAVRLIQVRAHDVVAFQRAGGTCLPDLFLDGVSIVNQAYTDLSAWVTPAELEGVELYPAPELVPGELRGSGCGAIALWTRTGGGPPLTLKRVLLAGGIVAAIVLLAAW